jgi:hypothetical protein
VPKDLPPRFLVSASRYALSCDVMGHMILVLAGEALAAAGVTRTSVILQAPSADLQVRREMALAALRNLTGAAQEAHGPNDWPRAQTALRQLHLELANNGASDLRAFLDEGYLGSVFDEMIALTSGGRAEQMRALGATSAVTVAQLERFLLVCQQVAKPESPPLANFLASIQYFVQAFSSTRSGYRLVYVARPPLLFYGLHGAGGPDDATDRLLRLIALRGEVAERLDCLCCGCDTEIAVALTIGGKALYDIDRAIDLLILGTDPAGHGAAELRAAGYGYIVNAAAATLKNADELKDPLNKIGAEKLLIWDGIFLALTTAETEARANSINRVLCGQSTAEAKWLELVSAMSAACRHKLLLGIATPPADSVVSQVIVAARSQLATDSGITLDPCPTIDVKIPQNLETAFEGFVEDVTLTGDGRLSVHER